MLCLFLTVPWVSIQYVIVAFASYAHLHLKYVHNFPYKTPLAYTIFSSGRKYADKTILFYMDASYDPDNNECYGTNLYLSVIMSTALS